MPRSIMLENSQFSTKILENIPGGELGPADSIGEKKIFSGVGHCTVTASVLSEESLI